MIRPAAVTGSPKGLRQLQTGADLSLFQEPRAYKTRVGGRRPRTHEAPGAETARRGSRSSEKMPSSKTCQGRRSQAGSALPLLANL